MTWAEVEVAVGEAKSIAFDGCHKIYVLMDDGQTNTMQAYGYGVDGSYLEIVADKKVALTLLQEWWSESCGLRFINAVKTVDGNPNEGFTSLISQTENDEEP